MKPFNIPLEEMLCRVLVPHQGMIKSVEFCSFLPPPNTVFYEPYKIEIFSTVKISISEALSPSFHFGKVEHELDIVFDPDLALGICSRVWTKKGERHLPFFDAYTLWPEFELPEAREIELLAKSLGYPKGYLVQGGSYYFYPVVERLLTKKEWKEFMRKAMNYDFIGEGYSVFLMKMGYAVQRLTCCTREPRPPKVVGTTLEQEGQLQMFLTL